MAKRWPQQTHDSYEGKKWKAVRAHLSGSVVGELERYLIRKRQAEPQAVYDTRKDIASYVPHYSRAILSLAGMIMGNEDDAERSWWDNETLGAPDEEGTVMARLSENVDGKGTDWDVHLTQVLNRLNGYQRLWGIVEGVERKAEGEEPTLADAQSEGHVRWISPLAVKDWTRGRSGQMTEVQVEYQIDRRGGVKEKHDKVTRWNVYTLDGVEVWEETEDAEEGPRLVGDRPYGPDGFQWEGRDGQPILPIWTTVVPVPMDVGYLMAKYATWLFNFRNMRNYHLWTTGVANGWVDATDDNGKFNQKLFQEVKKAAKETDKNVYPIEVGYSAPPMDGVTARNDTLQDERDAFYTTFFQSYGDAAREATATEIRHDVAQGVAAYLTLVVRALDEYENDALWRLAQVHEPEAGPEVWGEASVERSDDFDPENIRERIAQLKDAVFGRNTVPADEGTKVQTAKSIFEMLNVPYDEEGIEDAVAQRERRTRLRQGQRAAAEGETGVELDISEE